MLKPNNYFTIFGAKNKVGIMHKKRGILASAFVHDADILKIFTCGLDFSDELI